MCSLQMSTNVGLFREFGASSSFGNDRNKTELNVLSSIRNGTSPEAFASSAF